MPPVGHGGASVQNSLPGAPASGKNCDLSQTLSVSSAVSEKINATQPKDRLEALVTERKTLHDSQELSLMTPSNSEHGGSDDLDLQFSKEEGRYIRPSDCNFNPPSPPADEDLELVDENYLSLDGIDAKLFACMIKFLNCDKNIT
ncbi:hypothetical protein DH86_00004129 [Scytalidium sp. 3C]|nr:hypothetical protein DH86_00004129 [Scytalidium sp. 3C]